MECKLGQAKINSKKHHGVRNVKIIIFTFFAAQSVWLWLFSRIFLKANSFLHLLNDITSHITKHFIFWYCSTIILQKWDTASERHHGKVVRTEEIILLFDKLDLHLDSSPKTQLHSGSESKMLTKNGKSGVNATLFPNCLDYENLKSSCGCVRCKERHNI